MGFTFAQLKSRCGVTLQDTAHTTWTASSDGSGTGELDIYLNDGLREFAIATQCLRDAVTMTWAQGKDVARPYAFWQPPLNMAIIEWFDVWNAGVPLGRTTVRDELRRLTGWEDQTGTPLRYIVGDYGQAYMRVVPYPTAALTSMRALVSYVPPDMQSEGDTPPIPAMYQHFLHDYAVARAWQRDGEKQDLAAAQMYMTRWQQGVADAAAKVSEGFDQAERFVVMDWF